MNIQKLQKSDFPDNLSRIHSSPKELFLLGELPKDEVFVTIVGSRKPTSYGREITETIARDLAQAGAVVVSGLALGIDSIAHKACLDAGGQTVAVLPCGLDNIYPASHRNLAVQILESNGALISEYTAGTPALKQNFIARNRIVSGLSQATIIIEAAQKSGTLITAGFALEQNRDVYAVPGNITSPNSAGTNELINQGAGIITSSQQLLSNLGLNKEKRSISGESPVENLILDLLEQGLRDGDEIQAQAHLETSEFNQALTMMEITGKIKSLGANQWTSM